MIRIDFSKKLCHARQYNPQKNQSHEAKLREFESDRGRIINSAAIRRLQQKTQVFPLERNAAVRSRLTHSLEVQQIGRYIAKEIIAKLKARNLLDTYQLTGLEGGLESLVEMACLMHDIGNPPFGHFGEAAINHWFEKKLGFKTDLANEDTTTFNQLRFKSSDTTEVHQLKSQLRRDLIQFEGNAQGIRIIHSLQKLNLTYAQIGSVLKYTKPAYLEKTDIPHHLSYLMKKPGYYLSEAPLIETLANALDLKVGHRYFVTYIMEAADDISYCIADLEDAIEKNILSIDTLFSCLENEWESQGGHAEGDLFDTVIRSSFNSLSSSQYRTHDTQFFMRLRVKTISQLVALASDEFIQFLPEIYQGNLNRALLEGETEGFKLLSIFKNVAFKYVFSQSEVEELELQGYRVITGLLDIYSPLLMMPTQDFIELTQKDNHKTYLIETRLLHKLSSKHLFAYLESIDSLSETIKNTHFEQYEFYYRVRLIQDYISGMTDLYAYDEYRHLTVSNG